jgi:serine/threonine protein kinase
MSASGAAIAAGQKLGNYVVAGLLGAGGMGEVYRARDEKLERDVAIKLLPREFSGDPERLRASSRKRGPRRR